MSQADIPFDAALPALSAALGARASGWQARWRELDAIQQRDVASAWALVRATLDPSAGREFSIRTFRTGDIGMLAARQSILYAQSYGWVRPLEIIEGELTVQFLRGFQPGREQCWIAEVNGAMAGSVLMTDEGGGLARLRMLYVEPFARGRGIGAALVGQCVCFAREVGYNRVTLWTHTVLADARRLYARYGFHIVAAATHHEFGEKVDGETWILNF